MLSACWLIGAYFLAVSSHRRGRLNTSVYGNAITLVTRHILSLWKKNTETPVQILISKQIYTETSEPSLEALC